MQPMDGACCHQDILWSKLKTLTNFMLFVCSVDFPGLELCARQNSKPTLNFVIRCMFVHLNSRVFGNLFEIVPTRLYFLVKLKLH
ncbi:hypothetical protein Mapa_008692 [Marchantia paleacea]|nr:hypothetical protein Mapa_008692 [Marchantia paleacea]